MRRIFFALLVIIIFLQISAKNRTAKPNREFMRKFETVKYYLDLNDFEKAEILADSLFADSTYTDSLHYFKGLAFGGENNWKVAADEFSEVILLTKTESLRQKAEEKLQKSLLELHPTDAIEKVTAILDSLKNDGIQNDLFLIMAKVYEKNQLFEEAIDIYRNLLNERNFADTFYLHLKIAENDIFLKQYANALSNLRPILQRKNSAHLEDALFYSYLTNYSLQNLEKATSDLLQLYTEFPESDNRFEVIYNLAELFEEQGQYLLSWYFLNEIFATGTEAQKFVIYDKIEEIKKALLQDSLTVNQFKYFFPDLKKLRKN